jgi:sugar/nucleoside kinase (ribokinase family)
VGVNEKQTALTQEIVAGGPAANAAVTFALLGGDAELVTDLGRHPLAELARQDLMTHGVGCAPSSRTARQPRRSAASGCSTAPANDRSSR